MYLVIPGGQKKTGPTANTAQGLGMLPRGFVALITATATIWHNEMYRYDKQICMLPVCKAGANKIRCV